MNDADELDDLEPPVLEAFDAHPPLALHECDNLAPPVLSAPFPIDLQAAENATLPRDQNVATPRRSSRSNKGNRPDRFDDFVM